MAGYWKGCIMCVEECGDTYTMGNKHRKEMKVKKEDKKKEKS